MMDSHLTLRLTAELARALARWARAHGVPKSQVAREAVAHHLASPHAPPVRTTPFTAGDLAEQWRSLPRLNPEEADGLGADIEAGRRSLHPVPTPWG
ncbi:MAG: hypothetical protein SGI84_07130 [Gemmatimonadota bacterium]|nr:hypothetical protein [Gemmatimonadota bacterium]